MTQLGLLAIIEAYSITGPAKNLLEFARLARDSGVTTTIATFTRGSASNLFIDSARRAGIPVEPIPERGAFDPGVIGRLREITERLRPGIIQTHAVKSHFLARRAGLPRHAPWAAFHHGYTWPTLKARAYNLLDRWSLRAADRLVTVSLPFRDELVSQGVDASRIDVVHNAIAAGWGAEARRPEEAAKVRSRLGISPEKKVILIVGRLSREKDHLTLLDAVHGMPPELMPHLVIVGEGPERVRIEAHVRHLDLVSRVTLTGQQSSAEAFYGIADLAVLSSLSEGSPNALLEAMAAGVPTVATSVGGIPEIVTDGESALIVQPGDAAAMSGALSRLLANPELARRLASRSSELIRDRHAPLARVEKLLDIYRAMLARR